MEITHSLGICHGLLGNRWEALGYLDRCRRCCWRTGMEVLRRRALYDSALILSAEGWPQDAIQRFRAASTPIKETAATDISWRCDRDIWPLEAGARTETIERFLDILLEMHHRNPGDGYERDAFRLAEIQKHASLQSSIVTAWNRERFGGILQEHVDEHRRLIRARRNLQEPLVAVLQAACAAAAAGDPGRWNPRGSYALYERIFLPLLPELDGCRELIVCPGAGLCGVPLESLVSSPPDMETFEIVRRSASGPFDAYALLHYLVDDYTIRCLPSASILKTLDCAAEGGLPVTQAERHGPLEQLPLVIGSAVPDHQSIGETAEPSVMVSFDGVTPAAGDVLGLSEVFALQMNGRRGAVLAGNAASDSEVVAAALLYAGAGAAAPCGGPVPRDVLSDLLAAPGNPAGDPAANLRAANIALKRRLPHPCLWSSVVPFSRPGSVTRIAAPPPDPSLPPGWPDRARKPGP